VASVTCGLTADATSRTGIGSGTLCCYRVPWWSLLRFDFHSTVVRRPFDYCSTAIRRRTTVVRQSIRRRIVVLISLIALTSSMYILYKIVGDIEEKRAQCPSYGVLRLLRHVRVSRLNFYLHFIMLFINVYAAERPEICQ